MKIKKTICMNCKQRFETSRMNEIFCSLKCRILSSIEILENGCWNWLKGKDKNGYALMSIGDKSRRASRISYEVFKEKFDKDKIICHRCDNPSCINPDHLFVGNPKDNTIDMMLKKRDRVVGEKNVMSILTEDEVKAIRELSSLGWSNAKIGRIFHLDREHVRSIVKRKIWKHI